MSSGRALKRLQERFHDAEDEIEKEVIFEERQAKARPQGVMQSPLQEAGHCKSSMSPQFSIKGARNPLFTGREKVLNDLCEYLDPRNQNEPQSFRSHGLLGVGGSGKSQIALEYIYQRRNDHDHIFWLDAGCSVMLALSLRKLAKRLGVYQEARTIGANAEISCKWLQEACESYDMINSSRMLIYGI